MDTAANCGTTTDIYDELFTIRLHASTPNYRCVVTMNTGYSGTHAIEVISENVRIPDCGVRLGIYNYQLQTGTGTTLACLPSRSIRLHPWLLEGFVLLHL